MIKPNSFFKYAFKHNLGDYARTPQPLETELDFSGGEVFVNPPTKILNAFKSIQLDQLRKYTRCTFLKNKLAEYFDLDAKMIAVTNGSDELIENLPRIFLEPQDKSLFFLPTFFRFMESVGKMKGRLMEIKLKEQERFTITDRVVDHALKIIDRQKPKIVWLANPNNPTGAVVTPELIMRLVGATENLFILDEAYYEIFQPQSQKLEAKLFSKFDNLIILKTFSKAFGLAGIQIGFAFGQRNLISLIDQWLTPFSVNFASQLIAAEALKNHDHLFKVQSSITQEREYLFNEIKQLTHLKIGADSKTNLFILKHQTKDIWAELFRRGIKTANFKDALGLENKGYVRINIQSPEKNIRLMEALREIDSAGK